MSRVIAVGLNSRAKARAVLPRNAFACATCYGASDSPLAQGMNWGIMVLLCCIAGVLVTVTSFFVYIIRRSNALEAASTVSVSPESKQ